MKKRIIYDGKDAIFGRIASLIAKDLLKGNYVDLINCEEIVISGSKDFFVKKMIAKLKMGRGSSLKGPIYIRREDRLVKRMIRGMLPWDRPKGRGAYRRLKCYIGKGGLSEEDLKNAVKIKNRISGKNFKIKEVIKLLK